MKINFGQIVLLWGAATNIYRAFSKDCSGVKGIGDVKELQAKVLLNELKTPFIYLVNDGKLFKPGYSKYYGSGYLRVTEKLKKHPKQEFLTNTAIIKLLQKGKAVGINNPFEEIVGWGEDIGGITNRRTTGSVPCANGRYSTATGRGACAGNGGLKHPRTKRRNLSQSVQTVQLLDNFIM